MIELGAGTGFLSLFCAIDCGVKSVVATDREPALIENISDCVKRNGAEGVAFPGIWEWGTRMEDPGIHANGEKVGFDVAIGADLVGFPSSLPGGIDKCRYTTQISFLCSSQRSPISLRSTESRNSSSRLRYGIKTRSRHFLLRVVSSSLFPGGLV